MRFLWPIRIGGKADDDPEQLIVGVRPGGALYELDQAEVEAAKQATAAASRRTEVEARLAEARADGERMLEDQRARDAYDRSIIPRGFGGAR